MQDDEITTGKLFADLQVSLTELFLVEMLGDSELTGEFEERRRGNLEIVEGITAVMKERFSQEDIAGFLRNGFPRWVDISSVILEQDRVEKKLYTVTVFDEGDLIVDAAQDVLAWNRREAYFEVMNKLSPHARWEAEIQE